MLETVLLLLFCVLMGLGALAVVAWTTLTGRLLSLDGLALSLISLTLGAFFMFNIAWPMRTNELQGVLNYLREKLFKRGASGG